MSIILDEEHSQPWEQFGVYRTWVVEELGEPEVVGLCIQALNRVGAVIEEAHSFFGVGFESTVVEVDMLRVQALLETDVDPSLIAKWDWNDAE